MNSLIMVIIENVGLIAFAISGAVVAAKKDMDLFGINLMALVTATGGGLIRDIIIDRIPPVMFVNPSLTIITLITANIAFVVMYLKKPMPKGITPVYDKLLFWLDTLGLAAFTVDGAFAGIYSDYSDNLFLVAFLGVITGIGGGLIRDVIAYCLGTTGILKSSDDSLFSIEKRILNSCTGLELIHDLFVFCHDVFATFCQNTVSIFPITVPYVAHFTVKLFYGKKKFFLNHLIIGIVD